MISAVRNAHRVQLDMGVGDGCGYCEVGQMVSLRICATLLAAAVLGTAWLLPATATAQSGCDWYAKTALKQQQENEQRKCGFKGPQWNADLNAHTIWCRTVAPDVWKKEAQLRDQQLAACARK